MPLWACWLLPGQQSLAFFPPVTPPVNLVQAVERSSSGTSDGQKITFNMIKSRLGNLMYKITAQKFEDPADGEDKVRFMLSAGSFSRLC